MEIQLRENSFYQIYWFLLRLSRSGPFFRVAIDLAALSFYKIFRRTKKFIFNNHLYHYYYHLYNRTIASERIVEIPIAQHIMEIYQGKDILEMGNVLNHYFDQPHDVLDKYEKGKGVFNEDVVNFRSPKRYDLIISISTLEHVGFSYGEEHDSKKIPKAISNLKRFLKPGGKFFVTLPIGYNQYLTKLILDKKTGFNKTYFMKRISYMNDWKQVDFTEIKNCASYDTLYANSSALFVGEYTK